MKFIGRVGIRKTRVIKLHISIQKFIKKTIFLGVFKRYSRQLKPLIFVLAVIVAKGIRKQQYEKLETEVLSTLGIKNWNVVPYFDAYVTVKSRQTLGNYVINESINI